MGIVILHTLGKWRYVISGAAVLGLLWLLTNSISALLRPFGRWKCFRAECTAAREDGAAAVRFTEANGISRHAAFFPGRPLTPGQVCRIGIRAEAYRAGSWQMTLPEARRDRSDVADISVIRR